MRSIDAARLACREAHASVDPRASSGVRSVIRVIFMAARPDALRGETISVNVAELHEFCTLPTARAEGTPRQQNGCTGYAPEEQQQSQRPGPP